LRAGRGRSLLLALATVLGVAACGGDAPSAIPDPGTTTVLPSPDVAEPTDPPPATMTASPTPTGPTGSGSGLRVDEDLLLVLPPEVDGHPLEPAPDAAEQIAGDSNLRRDAVAVAVGMVVGMTAVTEDFAVASVVELGPGVFDRLFYAAWRGSYDDAACEPAGGVSRRAETEIDGRQVYIGTCVEGARTYHVHLPDPDRIVSITSVGEARYGQALVEGIDPDARVRP